MDQPAASVRKHERRQFTGLALPSGWRTHLLEHRRIRRRGLVLALATGLLTTQVVTAGVTRGRTHLTKTSATQRTSVLEVGPPRPALQSLHQLVVIAG
ncbi:hypothetical protein ACIHFD_03845 [Nonomuraea sp. NPDC051941]|uniref:hypothetical protein n=1 Tax=Nonomuraea sp. NPDC051941 TaxID=3364373 RepID=UPI0037CBB8A5